MTIKRGLNMVDQRKVTKFAQQGFTVQQIAKSLRAHPMTIRKFMPKAPEPPMDNGTDGLNQQKDE